MSHRKALLRRIYGSYYRIRRNLGAFIRWCIFSIIIGLVAGAVGAAFHHALGWATQMRTEHGWTLYFLPLAGLFIAFWYSRMDMPLERGTNFILTSVRRDHSVRRLGRPRGRGHSARRRDLGQYRPPHASGR